MTLDREHLEVQIAESITGMFQRVSHTSSLNRGGIYYMRTTNSVKPSEVRQHLRRMLTLIERGRECKWAHCSFQRRYLYKLYF